MFTVAAIFTALLWAQEKPVGFGTPATPEQIQARDTTVFPSGWGLPTGHGNAVSGKTIYREKSAVYQNNQGEGRAHRYSAFKGGIGTLNTTRPIKTVGSYWPYATTLWDYIYRAIPHDHPRALTKDEVYSVTAFVLHINGIVSEVLEMNEKTLPKIQMPNRDGFRPDRRPDIKSRC